MQSEDRIIREPECLRITGLSRTTRWRLMQKQEFPKCFKLGATAVAKGWRLSDIQSWIDRQATPENN